MYRQLGNSLAEMRRNLPLVHAQIEALFDAHRSTSDSERALQLVRERLGEWNAAVFKDRVVEPEWDVVDDFRELAEALVDKVPVDVARQIGGAQMQQEPMTLKRALEEYLGYKSQEGTDNRSLSTRVKRIEKDLIQVLGKNRFAWTPLKDITRKDANTYRDYLLGNMAPNSVKRILGIVKAAINHTLLEHDLDHRNVFAGIKIKGSGASKKDRLPISEDQLVEALPNFLNDSTAGALFVILRDTGCRLAEISGLLVGDINPEIQTLTISSNTKRSLKTKSSERVLPLSPEALEALLAHISDKAPEEAVFER